MPAIWGKTLKIALPKSKWVRVGRLGTKPKVHRFILET